jgi:ABC-type polysaccharide/polyol phosphate export permease
MATSLLPNPAVSSPTLTALQDLVGGFSRRELWGRIGWLEVKRRYRRTVIGPFWNSLTLIIYTLVVGIVGAGLWQMEIHYYLPYLSSGMMTWMLISTMVLESCSLFVTGHTLFRNIRFEYSVLAYALVWRNFVVFLHNLVIFLVMALVLEPKLISFVNLLAIPGVALLLVNGTWIALLIGMLCLRYRDVQPLVQSVLQIAMMITPIFWLPDSLGGTSRLFFVQLNPIYRMVDVVRSPLMGQIPTLASYAAVLAMMIVGWGLTFVIFIYFRSRLSYWS